jgi:hypothetical protein
MTVMLSVDLISAQVSFWFLSVVIDAMQTTPRKVGLNNNETLCGATSFVTLSSCFFMHNSVALLRINCAMFGNAF